MVDGGQEIGFDDATIVNYISPEGKNDYVSAETALRNSDIYSTVFQLSADLASSKLITSNSRNQGMLNNPITWSNAYSFWQAVYAQLLLGGEAFVYRWRNQNGIDVRWEYLRPSQVGVFALSDFSGLYYNISFDSPFVGVKQGVPSNDMIHFRLLSQNGGATGVSPLRSLSSELQIKKSSDKLTITALDKSVLAPGVLNIKAMVTINEPIPTSYQPFRSFYELADNITINDSNVIKSQTNETQNPISGKTVSIVGDSYSAFAGWIPEVNNTSYNETYNGVASVSSMWWFKVIQKFNMSLMLNESWSGSTICNTGYNASDATATSFLTRITKRYGATNTLGQKPQVLFVLGGLNDTWANSPLGNAKYSDWTTDDLKTVLGA